MSMPPSTSLSTLGNISNDPPCPPVQATTEPCASSEPQPTLSSVTRAELAPELIAFAALQDRLTARFNSEEIADITRAYTIARDAHEAQTRRSGEPYITHPIAVAGIVFDMELDHVSVMAALLHDVLEDTSVSREDLVDAFGDELASIVDGLSKLNHLDYKSKAEAQAESLRKMLLAMVKDLRVILIKLADRLHNMRTIGSLRPDKQRRIGRETLEVYAPIANRLGMYSIKNELEDLGFRSRYPMRSRILSTTVENARRNRDHVIGRFEERISASLSERGIDAKVLGREKHLYSLYRKMLEKQLTFQQVYDMFALRIVVNTEDECYRVLGIVHKLYMPRFRRFKDYIAVPKENGYRSLHTVLNYGEGLPVEVQIRTREMDQYAESGVAAHWAYKEGTNSDAPQKTRYWLNDLVDLQNNSADTMEFVESFKGDLFPGDIYVFTPKGQIIQLPENATPVDFAYAVHSQVGDTCKEAVVDRARMPLSMPLESGQTVEIITHPDTSPSPMWLNSVVTAKARTAIRHHLRQLDRTKATDFGERLLRRALGRFEQSLEGISDKAMHALLAEFRFADQIELFAQLGLGNHLPSQMAERLIAKQLGYSGMEQELPVQREAAPLVIEGREGSVVTLAKCCRPIPGDNVQGFLTPGQGVAVHRAGCRVVRRFRRRPKEWVAVDWAEGINDLFEGSITVYLMNQPGALARVTSTLSLMNVNIENIDFRNRADDNIDIRFDLAVHDRKQLARVIRRLRNLTVVRSVKRDS